MLGERLSAPDPNGTRPMALLVASGVVGGIWLLTTVVDSTTPAVLASLAGASIGVLTILRDTESPAGVAVTTLLLPVVGLTLLAAVLVPVRLLVPVPVGSIRATIPVAVGLFGLVGAAWLASFGVLGVWNRTVGRGSVAAMWTLNNRAAVGPVVLFVGILIRRFDALTKIPAIEVNLGLRSVLIAPQTAAVAMITFVVLCDFIIAGLQLILAAAPIVELTPQTDQARVKNSINRLSRLLNIVLLLGLSLMVGGILAVLLSVDIAALAERYPTIFALFAASGVRRALLAGFGLTIMTATVFAGVQLLTGRVATAVGWVVPGLLAGSITGVFAAFGTPAVSLLQERAPAALTPVITQVAAALTPAGVVAGVTTVGMSALTVGLGVVILGGGINYFPSEAAGSAMAATGLAIGAITLGIYGASGLTVFGVVGLSVFIWDIGDRSATTRTELQATSALQIEVLHLLSAAGIAAVGVALAWGLYANVLGQIGRTNGAVLAMVAASIGMVVLLAEIQG